jgi:hypothetical protein
MKEFDFEQLIKRTVRQLREELQKYKAQYNSEFKNIEDKTKQKPAEPNQVRQLLTTPEEYVLVFHIEDTGLVHAVPLTEYVNLTPSNLRIHLPNLTLAPLPYFVYVVREALEKISLPIAIVKEETAQKVVEEVEKTPHTSNIRPINEFIKLVWKRYEQLTIASLLYNAIKREGLDN